MPGADLPPEDGPGKYDDALTVARKLCGGRAAILIVLEGELGGGFSVQVPVSIIKDIPEILRGIADDVEKQLSKRK